MSEVSKAEQYGQEQAMFERQHDPGVLAVRAWLYGRQGSINSQWPSLSGEELLRLQGEARVVAKMIRLIEHGPAIKKPMEASTHG